MPQFNGKQEATCDEHGANLRCPRNGKRSDFALASAKSRFALDKPLGGARNSAPGKAAKTNPPARIPANTVAPRDFDRAVP